MNVQLGFIIAIKMPHVSIQETNSFANVKQAIREMEPIVKVSNILESDDEIKVGRVTFISLVDLPLRECAVFRCLNVFTIRFIGSCIHGIIHQQIYKVIGEPFRADAYHYEFIRNS